MRFVLALLIAAACFGQNVNVRQTGTIIPPQATFASPPSSPPAGAEWTFTDATSAGTCSGGGTSIAKCRWSGSAWQAVGAAGGGGSIATTASALRGNGAGGAIAVTGSGSNYVHVDGTSDAGPGGGGGGGGSPDTAIFTGGSQVQRYVQCASGTVPYTSLTTAGASQEITILTGVLGNARFDQLTVNPSTAFTGGTATLPTVSMGRPGSSDYEMTGTLLPVGSGSGLLTARPSPPQLTGTYSIVLAFSVATGNVNAFTAGSLDWEICGYASK
jgi:hypothetical protein